MSPGPTALPGSEIYATGGERRRAVVGWCLFDFANSSYTTLIVTVAFSLYFREVVVNATDNSGDRLWGVANFIAMAVVALTSPILGAIADYSGRKKLFFVLAALQTVLGTACLYFVGPGQVFAAMLFYVVATIGFEGGYVFYNSFLHEVSTPSTIGRVSGWGWAIGYVGGLLALVLCYPWITSELRDAAGRLIPAAVADRQLSFLIVAGFQLVASLPSFLWLRGGAPARRRVAWSTYPTLGFGRVLETLRHLRDYRQTGKYVLASLFFNDGITTIIVFSAAYATATFGFTSSELTQLFLVLNIVAFPGALLAGYLADYIGAKRTLVGSLWLWIGVVLLGFVAPNKTVFLVMAAGAAIGMSSTQAVGRSFMAQITPPQRESEFFGFYVLAGKFASIFGPLIFGLVSGATGSQRLAVLSLLPLFVIGLLLMMSVDADEACRRAAEPLGHKA